MADGTSPELDPLLDAIAKIIAVALDVDTVRIELFALGHPEVSLVGTHAEPNDSLQPERVQRSGATSISKDRTSASIPIPGTDPPGSFHVARRDGLQPDHLRFAERVATQLAPAACRLAAPPGRLGLGAEVRILKERRTIQALDRYGWNVAMAARALEVTRSFVYRVVQRVRERHRAKARRRA
jgi:hypothetical protein